MTVNDNTLLAARRLAETSGIALSAIIRFIEKQGGRRPRNSKLSEAQYEKVIDGILTQVDWLQDVAAGRSEPTLAPLPREICEAHMDKQRCEEW